MKTEQMQRENQNIYEAKPVISKSRKVFARTFGIPGLIFAIISMWFTVAQALVAMTTSGIAELLAKKFFNLSLTQIMNIPLLALCVCSLFWAFFAVILCTISKFLGTPLKINQTGIVLSVISSICSLSLACFSIVYMILA